MSAPIAAVLPFEIAAPIYGLKPEWQGRSFVVSAQAFRLYGLIGITSARNAVVQNIKSGKLLRMYPETVIRAFAVKEGA